MLVFINWMSSGYILWLHILFLFRKRSENRVKIMMGNLYITHASWKDVCACVCVCGSISTRWHLNLSWALAFHLLYFPVIRRVIVLSFYKRNISIKPRGGRSPWNSQPCHRHSDWWKTNCWPRFPCLDSRLMVHPSHARCEESFTHHFEKLSAWMRGLVPNNIAAVK